MKKEIEMLDKKLGKQSWFEHVKHWESGDLSQRAYCDRAGISISSFGYWRKQFLLETSPPKKSNQFVPVEVRQSQIDPSQSIKIKRTSGNVISIPTSLGISEIVKLIHLLEG